MCLHPSVALSSPHKTRDDPAPSLFALKAKSFPSGVVGWGVGGGGSIASYINIKLLEETECTTDQDVQQGFRAQVGVGGGATASYINIKLLEETDCTTDEDAQQGFRPQAGAAPHPSLHQSCIDLHFSVHSITYAVATVCR